MLEALRKRRRNREIVDELYASVVNRSRVPALFEDGGLPDTVMGRFEALSLEMFLALHRCSGDPELAPLAQDLVDRFMLDVDHSIRELGIGYQAVPKRMRKLAGRFYARVDALKGPLAARDGQALEAALRHSVLGEDGPRGAEQFLASHLLVESERLAHWPQEKILSGSLPRPAEDDEDVYGAD